MFKSIGNPLSVAFGIKYFMAVHGMVFSLYKLGFDDYSLINMYLMLRSFES